MQKLIHKKISFIKIKIMIRLKLKLRYEGFPYKVKMCDTAELYFCCEFSFSVVNSNSALDFYIENLFLAENLRSSLERNWSP